MVESKWLKVIICGFIGAFVSAVVSVLLFQGIGSGIIFNPQLQSPKLIAVWQTIQPLPLMTNNLLPFAIGWILIGIVQTLVFFYIIEGLPKDTLKRGLTFGIVLWCLKSLFFEFFTPFNLFGEPLYLVAMELSFWFITDIAEGLTLSFLYDKLN